MSVGRLPTRDGHGRPFGIGLASMAARLQLAARGEIMRALDLRRDLPGRAKVFPARNVHRLSRAHTELAPGGPFVLPDGTRAEDRSELRYVTCGVERAARLLRKVLPEVPEPVAGHVRRALDHAEGAQAIREATA